MNPRDFEGALCAETDPEAFFPTTGHSPQPAKAICRGCDWIEPCLDWALRNKPEGVWGGTTDAERRQIRRQRGIIVLPSRH